MSAQATKTFEMRLERTVRAPRERVFEAWTKPEHLKKWYAPEGLSVPNSELDLRVGGAFRTEMREPNGGATHVAVGTYREITPPSRLVFTWAWQPEGADDPVSGDETLITVELHEEGAATRVVMIHEGFATAQERDNHEQGWSTALDRLVALF